MAKSCFSRPAGRPVFLVYREVATVPGKHWGVTGRGALALVMALVGAKKGEPLVLRFRMDKARIYSLDFE